MTAGGQPGETSPPEPAEDDGDVADEPGDPVEKADEPAMPDEPDEQAAMGVEEESAGSSTVPARSPADAPDQPLVPEATETEKPTEGPATQAATDAEESVETPALEAEAGDEGSVGSPSPEAAAEVEEPAEAPAPEAVARAEESVGSPAPEAGAGVEEPAETPAPEAGAGVEEPAETPAPEAGAGVEEPAETPAPEAVVKAEEPADTAGAHAAAETEEPAAAEAEEPADTAEVQAAAEAEEPAETPVPEAVVKAEEPADTPEVQAATEVEEPAEAPEPEETVETPAAEARAQADTGAESAEPDIEPAAEPPQRRSRRRLLVGAVPIALIVLVVGGWAVDSAASSGRVARNVELAGQSIGGLDEDEVRELTTGLAQDQDDRRVTIRSGDQTYRSTAAALGLAVDEAATVDAALGVQRDGFPALRPARWAGSFLRPHELTPSYTVDHTMTAAALDALQGEARTAPVEPTMPLTEAGFAMVPGQPGHGIDPGQVADLLAAAASGSETSDGALEIEVEPTELPPRFDDADVESLADRANAMTEAGLTVKAGPAETTLSPQQLRSWMGLVAPPPDPAGRDSGELQLALDGGAVDSALPELVGPVGPEPVNASVTLDPAGVPIVLPGSDGVRCCGADAGTRLWEALENGQQQVELAIETAEPEWTTAEVQGWGITQPIGGSRAWRNGSEAPGPAPGFTTYHDCCASRVTNIHRLADLVRGAVIPPGGDFSINDHVGPRTASKGFVLAGAIANGMHVDEIGGGVSQFATTTFNAAYFAGLDIVEYQAHTEYFSRYPRGREATMGYPAPDLVIHNNTPYGVLIWTSYTGTSLTVTFYSTPWATAEQTGISESSSGACRNVSTTRTRWFPDGSTVEDTFRATYRPGEGRFC